MDLLSSTTPSLGEDSNGKVNKLQGRKRPACKREGWCEEVYVINIDAIA